MDSQIKPGLIWIKNAVGFYKQTPDTFFNLWSTTPTANNHVTTKKYVDDLIAGLEARIAALEAK